MYNHSSPRNFVINQTAHGTDEALTTHEKATLIILFLLLVADSIVNVMFN